MYLLGLDIGSSSVKAALLDANTGQAIASATSPDTELEMISLQPGWAEQHPDTWWHHIKQCVAKIRASHAGELGQLGAIGITYQMHGLVVVDKDGQVLRPSIIWCDSRAVEIGDKAFREIGEDKCLRHLLNSPGNFTASKLRWVRLNEPELYARIHKAMLPGDYIAYRLSGEIQTSISGLSEGILWDFLEGSPARLVLDYYGIDPDLLPEALESFGAHSQVSASAAQELGIPAGVPISYRAGDQPNNAFALGVLNPGEVAANAGTSGVIYGINGRATYDSASRVNSFVHVNHTAEHPRYGVLACVNGTGILNSWLRRTLSALHPGGEAVSYPAMNALAEGAPIGSEGLVFLPFGNGAERTLANKDVMARLLGLNFNTHHPAHLVRAAQEGIVFALAYGLEIMQEMGMEIQQVKAGHANMFLSPLFRTAFATVTGTTVELYETDGAQGAARGAGIGAGLLSADQAFASLKALSTLEPDTHSESAYAEAYAHWKTQLQAALSA